MTPLPDGANYNDPPGSATVGGTPAHVPTDVGDQVDNARPAAIAALAKLVQGSYQPDHYPLAHVQPVRRPQNGMDKQMGERPRTPSGAPS